MAASVSPCYLGRTLELSFVALHRVTPGMPSL